MSDEQIWLQEPLELNKYLIIGQSMTGTEFCRNTIRENFPNTISLDDWGKAHDKINKRVLRRLDNDVKVFYVLTDPRETYVYIQNVFKNRQYYDFQSLDKHMYDFVNNYNYYKKYVKKNNLFILKYEDLIFDMFNVIKKIEEFLGYKALFVDDVEKYRYESYKIPYSAHKHMISDTVNERIYKKYYKFFYENNYQYKYDDKSIVDYKRINYRDFLEKNHLNLNHYPDINPDDISFHVQYKW